MFRERRTEAPNNEPEIDNLHQDFIDECKQLIAKELRERCESSFKSQKDLLLEKLSRIYPPEEAKIKLEELKEKTIEKLIKNGKDEIASEAAALFSEGMEDSFTSNAPVL